jgi:hypothetical protein
VLFLASGSVVATVETPWVEVGRSDGVVVLRQEIPGDPVFAYRGQGILDAPFGKLISVALDVKRQPEWVNRLEAARILREITPLHRIVYLKVDSPWPVSDRDFVIESKYTLDRDKHQFLLEAHSVEDPSMPPQDCCVRGIVHRNRSEFTASPDGLQTKVDAEAHVDPKGSLPAWVINLVQKTFPHKSIRGLLKQVGKADVPDYLAAPSS